MTVFVRVLGSSPDAKAFDLLSAIRGRRENTRSEDVFDVEPAVFAEIPGVPFAYWTSEGVRSVFARFPTFESNERTARHGAATLDDFRFLRLWTETESRATEWAPFAKGGENAPYYTEIPLMFRWATDGNEVKAFVAAKVGSSSRTIQATDFYFLPGLTWPLRAQRFAPQALPAGCIFSARGYSAFLPDDELLTTLAIFNSSCFDSLYKILLGRFGYPEFIVGVLQKMPWTAPGGVVRAELSVLALRAWSLMRSLSIANETSRAFLLPTALGANRFASIQREVVTIQCNIDDIVFDLYEIDSEDRATIEGSTNVGPAEIIASSIEREEPSGDVESLDDRLRPVAEVDALNSWMVGVAFGRFDARLATGERECPAEPTPFDHLPTRSPGMWPESEQRKVEPPVVLVDDPGHKLDIVQHVAAVVERVAADVPDNLRAWLAKEFFPLHIKMYSKSRRKAPIYWQLATPSASYSVWLYIHAFTKDTFFHVQELVTLKVEHEQRKLESQRTDLKDASTSADRKALAAQETFVEELRGMLDEVKRVKPLWKPDLDDGVVINFAPLWRLVPHHKAWQKELKATWDALCAREYDWSHLAMHLWPEHVVPKCVTDRSLAIAHGLEDVFWFEDSDGKWKPRPTHTRSVSELVAERTSAAVKAARDSLVSATTPGGGSGKTRRKRATGPKRRR